MIITGFIIWIKYGKTLKFYIDFKRVTVISFHNGLRDKNIEFFYASEN